MKRPPIHRLLQILALAIILIPKPSTLNAQVDTTKIRLDLLRAPASPGANLLGFAVSDIEKPTDVTDFMVSLQSATNNYTVLPTNFAVDLAPFWLFRARGLTTDKMDSRRFGDVFRQSFVVSNAFRNADSTSREFSRNNLYHGIGLKFSVIRGRLSVENRQLLDSIHKLQGRIASGITPGLQQALEKDSTYQQLRRQRQQLLLQDPDNPDAAQISELMRKRQDQVVGELSGGYKEELEALKKLASTFRIQRYGFFLDFAGGMSMEYVNRSFNGARVYNGGAWVSTGANYRNGWTIMALARYLYNPRKIFADDLGTIKQRNLSTFDAGGRVVYEHPESRFSLSGEAIYRSVLTRNTIDPSWRLILNAEYDLRNNTRLTFLFGRSFDGTISRSGNVVAALNFLKGLGGIR